MTPDSSTVDPNPEKSPEGRNSTEGELAKFRNDEDSEFIEKRISSQSDSEYHNGEFTRRRSNSGGSDSALNLSMRSEEREKEGEGEGDGEGEGRERKCESERKSPETSQSHVIRHPALQVPVFHGEDTIIRCA